MEHNEWDEETIFDWLVFEGEGIYDLAAADLLCATLLAVADGNSALAGGPTDLPSARDVCGGKDPTPEQEARWRESVEDTDLPKRELLLKWCLDEDGSLVKHLLKTLAQSKAWSTERGRDWWLSDRTDFVSSLVVWVRRYRAWTREDV
jgi:hypothetical protein